MATEIHSFSFSRPPELPLRVRRRALIIDVRGWPNPHQKVELRALTGRDRAVGDYIRLALGEAEFNSRLIELLAKAASHPDSVWIGCQGGRHRSVFLAEEIGRTLGLPIRHHGLKTDLTGRPVRGMALRFVDQTGD